MTRRSTRRNPLTVAVVLAAVLVAGAWAVPADASQPRSLRRQLYRETTMLRNQLMNSPAVLDARLELRQATRDYNAERARIRDALKDDEGYAKLLRELWQGQREFKEILTWALPASDYRVKFALYLLDLKGDLRAYETTAQAGDDAYRLARERMVLARLEMKAALDEVDRRVREDNRLERMRGRLRSAVASIR